MKNNNRGFSLIELLIAVAVSALAAPLVFWIFSYGIQSYSSYSKYMEQHYKVMDVTQRIRKDIEEAAAYKVVYDATVTPIPASVLTLWIPDGDSDYNTFTIRTWRIGDGGLFLKSSTGTAEDGRAAALDGSGYSGVLDGLDTATVEAVPNYMPTRFECIDDRILLSIKPLADNTAAAKNRNVNQPVVTEFSVRYKEKIN